MCYCLHINEVDIMRTVNTIKELKLPRLHEIYLERLLEYLGSYPKIERVLLFGSCAKGQATRNSDIDLFLLGAGMTDEDEWNIVWNCPKWSDLDYIPCDLLSGTFEKYEEMSKVPGMIQHSIELRGVDISELLHAR